VNPLIHLLDRCPDDEVAELLGVLADALEDDGDVRAAGFRLIGDRRPRHWTCHATEEWQWFNAAPRTGESSAWLIPPDTWGRLAPTITDTSAKAYPSRSAAFIALAEALVIGGPAVICRHGIDYAVLEGHEREPPYTFSLVAERQGRRYRICRLVLGGSVSIHPID
jgi:hypothetical protein